MNHVFSINIRYNGQLASVTRSENPDDMPEIRLQFAVVAVDRNQYSSNDIQYDLAPIDSLLS